MFQVQHIPGKQNVFADWLWRLHWVEDCDLGAVANVSDAEHDRAVEEALRSVHNARSGHHGLRRTWLLLNEHYPGHAISQKAIREFIEVCPQCQKYRLPMRDSLPAPKRVLDSQHRHTCGYDLQYITPEDKEGYKYLHVVKLMPSRIVGLYPSKDLSAESLALALFQFMVTYGVSDVLITDPGSNIDSEVVKLLLDWFGIRLQMSLVNRHQSNGVERTHREILRFLSMLINHERVAEIWSKPHIICIVQFIINSQMLRRGQHRLSSCLGAWMRNFSDCQCPMARKLRTNSSGS